MEKTQIPKIIGLLNIFSGIFSLFAVVAIVPGTIILVTYDYFVEPSIIRSAMFLLVITGILAIVGGSVARNRKMWGLALAGSIAALLPLLLPGILAIILTVRFKEEFQ